MGPFVTDSTTDLEHDEIFDLPNARLVVRNLQRADTSLLPTGVLGGIVYNLVTILDLVDVAIDLESGTPGTLVKVLHRKNIVIIICNKRAKELAYHATSSLLVPVSERLDATAYKELLTI